MPKFDSELVQHVQPYTRSIGAPWSPLMPSRSFPNEGIASGLETSDNATDWSPYEGLQESAPYLDEVKLPHTPRHAPWVTPLGMWNVAGVNGDGGISPWPIVRHPEMDVVHSFGFPKPFQIPWAVSPGVERNLVSVPPPMPFLGAPL